MNRIQDLKILGRDLQQLQHTEHIVIDGGDGDGGGDGIGIVDHQPPQQQQQQLLSSEQLLKQQQSLDDTIAQQQLQQHHKRIDPTTKNKSLSCSSINNGGSTTSTKQMLQVLKKWNKSATGRSTSNSSGSDEEEQGRHQDCSGEIKVAVQMNNYHSNGAGDDSTVDMTEFDLSANSSLTSNILHDSFMLNSPVIGSSSSNDNTVPLRNNTRHPSIFSPEDPSSDLEFHGHLPLMPVVEDDATSTPTTAAVAAVAAAMETQMENSSQSSSETEAETKQGEVGDTVAATRTSMEDGSTPAPISDVQSIAVSEETPLIANTTTAVVTATSSDEPTSTPPPSNLKTVRWGTIQIYEHVITMGLTSIPSCGAPVSLSNEPAQATYTFPIDEYESLRVAPPRKGQEMILTRRKRSDMLLELGFTMTEIARCVRESQVIRQQRAQSAHRPKLLMWWLRLKFAVKKARGKKAAIIGRKDDIDSSYTSRMSSGSQESSDAMVTADEGRLMVKTKSEVDLFILRERK
eukprot:CAMPEP_0113451704 /NCGR_PEP_ID=MMETSP0014_2-20120614/6474_1 /TAXON_ID=2857 /ORGANISM="Nitzschia sp." /LENGTH=516 /DNA_ID=CAMNT_0000343065 /DNA_START=568 /DNA_END=2118 /DNA_ORIENTATION=+ /assembly_acc=CAM_ASM_000159